MFAKLLRPQLKGLFKAFPRCCSYSTHEIFHHTQQFHHNNISKNNIANPISQPMRTISTGKLYYGPHALGNDVGSSSIEEERVANMEKQRENRCHLVIMGIPEYIKDEDLQWEVLKILQNMNVSLDEKEIVKVNRLRDGRTLCQFVDHDCLIEVLRTTSGPHDEVNIRGSNVRIFILPKLTKEYQHLYRAIRVAKRKGKIFRYRLSSDGVNQVKLSSDDNEFYDITHRSDLKNKGLYFLEGHLSPETKEEEVEEQRKRYKRLQRQRMNSVVISGLPEHTGADETNLLHEVLTVLQTANPFLDEKDIVKVFRVGSQVICKFVNQECVRGILRNKFSFEDEESTFDIPGIYVEPSLIHQYADIYRVLQRAKQDGRILHYRLTHDGIHQVQLSIDGEFYDISHEADLINIGLSMDEEEEAQSIDPDFVEEERKRYEHLQERRRNSVAISGIPLHVKKENLLHHVSNILQSVSASVEQNDILRVFRLGSEVVCKFKDHNCTMDIVNNSAHLQSTSGRFYGEKSSIHIKYSLIKEYAHLNYAIRKAYEKGKLHSYRVHDGINQIKVHEDDLHFKNITHKMDLIALGLYLESTEL